MITISLCFAFFPQEVGGDCPLELSDLKLNASELVVQYGDPISVSCNTSFSNYRDFGWSVPLGKVFINNQTSIWETDSLTEWEIQPVCYMTLANSTVQCNRTLTLIIYSKYPSAD